MTTTIREKRISKNLTRYSGKWVAFVDEKVIAWANTLEELDKKVNYPTAASCGVS